MKYTDHPEVPGCESRGILEVLPAYSGSSATMIIQSKFSTYDFLLHSSLLCMTLANA